ncbi:hypothetical protein Y032_0358g3403 [Ancylostoma ceylanicum]|uniref:SCP domain-containing protein n=1 Tax=Ancylostoma ceylanicum TaxID=53326 RepID=A0A016RWN8_9BILA|nr:hypothetical protein Y032_0358g3403 [Ancylostoma ceylanicum]
MEHLWITLISLSPLLLLFRGKLRTCASIDVGHAKLPISVSQPLIADGVGLPKIRWDHKLYELLKSQKRNRQLARLSHSHNEPRMNCSIEMLQWASMAVTLSISRKARSATALLTKESSSSTNLGFLDSRLSHLKETDKKTDYQ